uniref:Uncharacterized protein n=1 Tax=Anguilla anguilla TaxID=7936 RepID=A0A0E9XSH5_ANGAN
MSFFLFNGTDKSVDISLSLLNFANRAKAIVVCTISTYKDGDRAVVSLPRMLVC